MTGLNLGSDATYIDDLCKRLGRESATRITVILPSGKVIGDTDEDPAKMENHSNRPEVQDAFNGRIGIATRYSHTLYETMMYAAVPIIENGQVVGIVRTSLPITSIEHAFGSIYTKVIVGGLLIAVLAALSTYYTTIAGLRIEMAKKAEDAFVAGLDKRISNLEVRLSESFATKEDFYELKQDLVLRLSRIEFQLSKKESSLEY